MAIVSDKNLIRESLVDIVLSAVISGENTTLQRGSIVPKVIQGGQIVNSISDDYSKRVIFKDDYKAIFGYGGDFIDVAIENCYKYTDGFFENPDSWSEEIICEGVDDPVGSGCTQAGEVIIESGMLYTDASTNTITLNNCVAGTSETPEVGIQYIFDIDDDYINNFLSQHITFQTGSIDIDSISAEQILDTTIYELIPENITRQQRINKWFSEFYRLIGSVPPFDLDVDFDGISDTWETTQLSSQQDTYSTLSDIVENSIDGNITRLDRHAKSTTNEGKTLEFLRNTINSHLTDIDKSINPQIEDSRPEYENISDGYLKIRSLNQSILVRNETGDDIGIIGEDPNNPDYLSTGTTVAMWVRFLDRTGGGTIFNYGNPVRSINPTGIRLEIYTLYKNDLVRPDKTYTWGEYIQSHTEGFDGDLHAEIDTNEQKFDETHTFFQDSDYERFIRLIVREGGASNVVRDSHLGCRNFKEGLRFKRLNKTGSGGVNKIPANGKYPIIWPEDQAEADDFYPAYLLTATRIPIDFEEWFFVVASYDPDIMEDESFAYAESLAPDATNTLQYFSEFWQGHVIPEAQDPTANQILNNASAEGQLIGKYTPRSGYGNRCKVEFISKSQLLRARGFKVEGLEIDSADTSQTVGG